MNGQNKTRTRQERIESLGIPKPRLVQWWNDSDKAAWSIRVTIAVVAALAVLTICRAWEPRFAFRTASVPSRDVIARVNFEVENELETEALRLEKIREVPVYYRNRLTPLEQLRAQLRNRLFLILESDSLQEMDEEQLKRFNEFAALDPITPESEADVVSPEDAFAAIKLTLGEDMELEKLDVAFRSLVTSEFKDGLLQGLKHEPEEGSQRVIQVYVTDPVEAVHVDLDDVQIGRMSGKIQSALREDFRRLFDTDEAQLVAKMVGNWIDARLPEYETLTYDDEASEKRRAEISASVPAVMKRYRSGQSELADGGDPLDEDELQLLRHEHQQWVQYRGATDRATRFIAFAGMIAAVYLLCGSYILFVDDRSLLLDYRKLSKLLVFFVCTVGLSYWVANDRFRSELAPLAVASIIAAIVYGRDMALLMLAAASICVTLFMGESLGHLVMLAAACTSCTLLTGRIRSHSHLIFVGGVSAVVTILTVVGVGIVTGETMTIQPDVEGEAIGAKALPGFALIFSLLKDGVSSGAFILVSAAALTPLLPLVEKSFGVQTDLSLLGLSDASHPLLRRLAQRAPGTYNHSINVASIAEAAADAIGANGLLVRVGAYFHDIGKMFKPEYFIENQSGVNQHDSLQPAMSTLVIIAHVKDGADLARKHHLPQPLIDLILQHHGTTLVEYFFNEAAKRSEENPNEKEVSDKDFRYPGPKPQTLEAAVMMLADTVESASRTLVDPTPARIQSLVDKIAEKKMADGQFDECGLTFQQLNLVRKSLVKSLTAIYHARVKYPQPA
ncbi:MAG: HDIG domain-containing metalloprotein [Planctomycetota bacterium]